MLRDSVRSSALNNIILVLWRCPEFLDVAIWSRSAPRCNLTRSTHLHIAQILTRRPELLGILLWCPEPLWIFTRCTAHSYLVIRTGRSHKLLVVVILGRRTSFANSLAMLHLSLRYKHLLGLLLPATF